MGSGDKRALKKLKKLLQIEQLDAEMTLLEPKEKSKEENDARIFAFCRELGVTADD